METLRDIWADIRRDLKQNKDDLEISDMQGWYWTLAAADRLRMLHLQKRRSGAFRSSFVLPVLTDQVHPNRPYVELPVTIYDLDMDRGVDSVAYYVQNATEPGFALVEGFRIDPSELRMFTMHPLKAPRPDRFYFWREGARLYMAGILASTPFMELKLYTNLPDVRTVNPDLPLDFPKELLYVLKRTVIENGRYALALPGQYLRNDGTNRPRGMALGEPEKTQSVNDPMNNTGVAPEQ